VTVVTLSGWGYHFAEEGGTVPAAEATSGEGAATRLSKSQWVSLRVLTMMSVSIGALGYKSRQDSRRFRGYDNEFKTLMTPERFQRIESLFHRAIELPTDQRAGFLASACGDDRDLRREVENLLTPSYNLQGLGTL
jgi:hypothetical protein